MTIIRIDIDLAENSFALCGIDERENVVLDKILKRCDLLTFFCNIPLCVVAMEAGFGVHR